MDDELLSRDVPDLSDSDGILTLVTPDPKVPEDQESIDEMLKSKSESESLALQDAFPSVVDLDMSGFTSISLCCSLIILLAAFLSRR